jgi:hypothetical protein
MKETYLARNPATDEAVKAADKARTEENELAINGNIPGATTDPDE